jgi:ABC-type transport system substrate-binding protein
MALVVGVATLSGCTYAPPPPLVERSPLPTTGRPVDLTEIVVGVDSLEGDFNPHTLPDSAPANNAVAELVLPSVFRPGPDGTPVLDTALAAEARVSAEEPFTVEYTLDKAASWSDGAPIAVEDFVYLWQRMRSEPGVVDPAGYRLISTITARDGGKTVVVTFSKPYPGWRSLFGDLLPSHLIKDAPGGWATSFSDGLSVSGHRFAVKSVDRARHEIVLERNDRYWRTPIRPNRVILRETDHRGAVDALKRGDDQLAMLRSDAITAKMLAELGDTVGTGVAPRPTVVQVLLRPAGSRLGDQSTRKAVAALIDRDALIATGTASGPSVKLRVDAHVLVPGLPGYTPTIPAEDAPGHPDPALARRLLEQTGYQRSEGMYTKNGVPLEVTVGAPRREPYQTLAVNIRRQLAEAGVPARLVEVTEPTVVGPTGPKRPTTTGPTVADREPSPDIVVVGRQLAEDPATGLASAFGCPASLPGLQERVPANPAGFCDPLLQPTIDAALTGNTPLPQALSVLEPVLWRQAVAIPLFQLADTVVRRPEMTGVGPGTLFAGPLTGAGEWHREAVVG